MEYKNYPGIFLRVKAAFIDVFIMIILSLAASDLFSNINADSTYKILVFVLIFMLYEPLMVSINKATIGQRLLKLKVEKLNTGKRLNIVSAIIRFLIKSLLGWISLFTISSNQNNQAIHDIAVNSIVVFDEDYT